MFRSQGNNEYLANPRKTNCKNIEQFIKETCHFYAGAQTIAQDAYDKYVRYCNDRSLEYSCFNTFARAFKYNILSANPIYGVGLFRCNYQAYKEGHGYISKQGWAYSNLIIHY